MTLWREKSEYGILIEEGTICGEMIRVFIIKDSNMAI